VHSIPCRERRRAGARRALVARLAADSRDAAAWSALSRLELRGGELATARLCAEAAVSLAPSDERMRLVRARVLLREAGGFDRGRHDLAEIASLPGSPLRRRAAALLRALER